jgi:hypothetical protein
MHGILHQLTAHSHSAELSKIDKPQFAYLSKLRAACAWVESLTHGQKPVGLSALRCGSTGSVWAVGGEHSATREIACSVRFDCSNARQRAHGTLVRC